MAEEKTFAIEDYLRIILYRKWLLIIPVITIVLVTGIGSLFMKNIYRSYTLILVEPQRVPEEFVKATSTVTVDRQMNTIRQQMMSRSLLERVIAEYNLFPDLIAKNVPMEQIVELMRKNIDLRVEGKDAFTLYYVGPDPYIVMQVTNKLASLFIEGTSQAREQQASDTVKFLENNRDELKGQLEVLEKKIQAYKSEHIGELPEQREANLRTIERLQMQLQTSSEALRSAEDRVTLISGQLANLKQKSMISGTGGEMVGVDMQLEKLKADLANLELKYTDEHPDVIKLKSKIANLEEKSAKGNYGSSGGAMTQSMDNNLRAATMDANRVRAERGSIMGQIQKYQERIEGEPKIEQELSIYTRDYDNLRKSYEDILAKLTEAQRSSDMESKQKGQQFRIVDPAKQNNVPYKPNRPYIVIIGFALGMMIGFGAVFIAEHFDDSFKNPEELEEALGLTVLTAIPKIETQADIDRRNKMVQIGIIVACSLAALAVVFIIIKFSFGR
jgi:polysaccharide chain length determinant protein (PEP-CTERM system associated)